MQNHPFFMQHHGGGGHPFAWILMLLLVVLIVALIVSFFNRPANRRWAFAPPGPRHAPGHGGGDPLELVRLRYARGDIDRETYLQISEDLSGGAPPGPAAN